MESINELTNGHRLEENFATYLQNICVFTEETFIEFCISEIKFQENLL